MVAPELVNAVQVADRFHLARYVGAGLDEVVRNRTRRKEIERMQIETTKPIVVPTALPLPPDQQSSGREQLRPDV